MIMSNTIDRLEESTTVKELCEALQRIPEIQNLPIVVDGNFLEGFQIIRNFPLGDPSSPYGCEYCEALALV